MNSRKQCFTREQKKTFPEVKQLSVSSNGVSLTASQVSTSLWRTFQREGIVTEGRISATILRKSLATGMHVYMPDEKEHLAALAQHKTQTKPTTIASKTKFEKPIWVTEQSVNCFPEQCKYSPGTEAERDKPATGKQWTAEETEQMRQLFKQDLKTGAIEEPKVKKILSTSHLKEERSLKAVVLKLRRMREDMKAKLPPCEEETCYGKVMKFLHSAPHQPPSLAHTSGSVSVESSGFWREFTEEQTDHLLSLTRDLIDNGTIRNRRRG